MNIRLLKITVISLFYLISCTHKIEGDIHPDIPELNDMKTEKIEIRQLNNIETIHYAKNGDIHLFGHVVDSYNKKEQRMLWRYTKDFRIIDSIFITNNVHKGWFMDASSNVYILNDLNRYNKLTYPKFESTLIPFHPAYSGINTILNKEIQSYSHGSNSDIYKELEKAGRLDEVEKNNDEVAEELADYYEDNISLKTIKYCYYFSGNYILFMKNGSCFTLPSVQLSNGKSALGNYLNNDNKMRIYGGYQTNDWSVSIANLELNNAEYVTNTDFSVTESVSTLDNWPNLGYTRGYYYYKLQMNAFNYAFKIKGSINKTILHEVSKPRQKAFFIKANKWYLIRCF